MLALLALVFVVIPIVELTVIIQVGGAIGVANTLGLVILVSVFGAWLTRHEGFLVLRRIQEQLEAGRIPSNEVIDGGLILGGGLLLLTPGFVTDGVGLAMLFPPTRILLRTFLRRRFALRVSYEHLGRDGRRPPDDVIDL